MKGTHCEKRQKSPLGRGKVQNLGEEASYKKITGRHNSNKNTSQKRTNGVFLMSDTSSLKRLCSDFSSMTFWKRPNCGQLKVGGARGGEVRGERREHRGLVGRETPV